MSMGIRTIARIEQRATPITNTMIVSGRRSAARSSRILTVLLGFYRAEAAGRAGDRLAMRRPKPSSAKPRAAQERRRFLLARADFAHPRRLRASLILLGNARVPGSRLC